MILEKAWPENYNVRDASVSNIITLTNATQTFSAVKHIKIFFRNTSTGNRLNHYSISHVHCGKTNPTPPIWWKRLMTPKVLVRLSEDIRGKSNLKIVNGITKRCKIVQKNLKNSHYPSLPRLLKTKNEIPIVVVIIYITLNNCKLGLRIFFFFFFYLGFLSRTFTIHGTAGEGGGYLFNSSLRISFKPL